MKFSDLPIGTFFYFPGCGALCLKTKLDSYQPAGYSSKPTRGLNSPVILAEEDFDGKPIDNQTIFLTGAKYELD